MRLLASVEGCGRGAATRLVPLPSFSVRAKVRKDREEGRRKDRAAWEGRLGIV